MTVFQFVLGSLCCYRLVLLLTRDIGPFGSMRSLRKLNPKLLGCPYCSSIWIAAGLEAGFYFCGHRSDAVIMVCEVFAMSAVAVILHRTFSADYLP